MLPDAAALYTALSARDARFDGIFYVGVTSTGIYCRPVCTARTPKAANCRFFENAAAAEKADFRPCLRCRPELAPGHAPVDGARVIASLVVRRIDEGMLDDGAGMETIAAQFGWSSRQIRRILNRELGVSPMELVLTRRLLLAKQLLTDTSLSVSEIALASGFSSLRRFNDAFSRRYRMPPTRFRQAAEGTRSAAPSDCLTLQLGYRPPFDWNGLLAFLAARSMKGVESFENGQYLRAVHLGDSQGWVRVRHAPERHALLVDVAHSLTPVLPVLLGRVRNLFDLDARPDVIAAHLAQDPVLAPAVARQPGLRVPGAFDGFELGVRAILGQQITVKAATTLGGRFAEAFGEAVATPYAELMRVAPSAQRMAEASEAEIAALGIARPRARSILALANEVASGGLVLGAGGDPPRAMERLVSLPGIGPWTAGYIAMRALRWPDAFPKDDLVLRKRLGGVTAAHADAQSQAWRPWRSYATLHLWRAAWMSPEPVRHSSPRARDGSMVAMRRAGM